MLEPKSFDAKLIYDLYQIIFYLAVVVFILVEGLLIYSAAKFRRQSASDMPVQVHGNNKMELLWTVLPALLVTVIFFISVDTMTRMSAKGTITNSIPHVHALNDKVTEKRVKEAAPVEHVIEVTGRQWFWIYNYGDGVTINSSNGDLLVPAGRNIRLDMTSGDVIHAWYIPQLGPMIYVNPGDRSYVWFNAKEKGEFFGQCNFFCGVAHANMLSKVKVIPAEEFDQWLDAEIVKADAPAGPGDPERGKQIMTNTGPCKACHSIAGTAAQGKVAPRELTKFATYPTIAQIDGFENNAENLAKWLKDPQAVKPGTAMPNNALKKQEIADLVAYLQTLR